MPPKKKTSKPRGRPAWQPTDKERGAVQALSGVGFDEEFIGRYIGKDPKTLRKTCARELEFATAELLALGFSKLAAAVKKGESWAICFLFKTKGKKLGWTERQELSGPNGGPIQHAGLMFDPAKLKDMDDDELAALERAVGKLQRNDSGDQGRAAAEGDADEYSASINSAEGDMAT